MKDQRKTEVRVGVTVLLGIIVFLWILGWAKNFSLTPTENTVKVKFNNTSGLEIGDPVTVNGVRKGFVEDLKVDGNGVIVTLQVDNSVRLNEDAKFAVSMLDLMGGKKIEITPGISSDGINYSKIQEGTFYADVPQVMSMLGSFQEDFSSTISDVKITLTALNDYLTDKDFNRNIKASLSGLNDLTQKLNLLINENRENFKIIISNTAELTQEAKNFLEENKGKMNSSVDQLQSVLKNTDELMIKLNKFSDEMTNKQNNFGKLLYDEKIYNDLTQSIKQLNDLTKLMIEQLQGDGLNVDANIF